MSCTRCLEGWIVDDLCDDCRADLAHIARLEAEYDHARTVRPIGVIADELVAAYAADRILVGSTPNTDVVDATIDEQVSA